MPELPTDQADIEGTFNTLGFERSKVFPDDGSERVDEKGPNGELIFTQSFSRKDERHNSTHFYTIKGHYDSRSQEYVLSFGPESGWTDAVLASLSKDFFRSIEQEEAITEELEEFKRKMGIPEGFDLGILALKLTQKAPYQLRGRDLGEVYRRLEAGLKALGYIDREKSLQEIGMATSNLHVEKVGMPG